MKTSEQMTIDVLKRRDEELKARKPHTIRRITTVAVPCAAALVVTAVTAAGIHSVVGIERGDNIVDSNIANFGYMGDTLGPGNAEIWNVSGGSENFCASYPQTNCTSYPQTDMATVTSENDWFLKNPNAGKYVFRTAVLEHIFDDLKVIEYSPDYKELSDPKYTFIPYKNEGLSKHYNIEFDRFGRLHPDWNESTDRQTGVYYLEEHNKSTTSIELKCDTNTLNYTTPSGAKISVTAQKRRFIPETVSSTSVERPKPEVNYTYDENGNVTGAFTPGYDPGNIGAASGNDDSIETDIYTNSGETRFLAYIDMGVWVKIYAEGLSGVDEFIELIEEYTN